MKIIILVLLAVVLYCLGSAMFYMVSSKRKNPQKTANALAWRIGISLCVFFLLLIGFLMGWIRPHGI